MTFCTTDTSTLQAEASFISTERGLHQGILSRTSLKCHIHFGFILKLVIFICNQLKRPVAFGTMNWGTFAPGCPGVDMGELSVMRSQVGPSSIKPMRHSAVPLVAQLKHVFSVRLAAGVQGSKLCCGGHRGSLWGRQARDSQCIEHGHVRWCGLEIATFNSLG